MKLETRSPPFQPLQTLNKNASSYSIQLYKPAFRCPRRFLAPVRTHTRQGLLVANFLRSSLLQLGQKNENWVETSIKNEEEESNQRSQCVWSMKQKSGAA